MKGCVLFLFFPCTFVICFRYATSSFRKHDSSHSQDLVVRWTQCTLSQRVVTEAIQTTSSKPSQNKKFTLNVVVFGQTGISHVRP